MKLFEYPIKCCFIHLVRDFIIQIEGSYGFMAVEQLKNLLLSRSVALFVISKIDEEFVVQFNSSFVIAI